jgi:hypothetical protein
MIRACEPVLTNADDVSAMLDTVAPVDRIPLKNLSTYTFPGTELLAPVYCMEKFSRPVVSNDTDVVPMPSAAVLTPVAVLEPRAVTPVNAPVFNALITEADPEFVNIEPADTPSVTLETMFVLLLCAAILKLTVAALFCTEYARFELRAEDAEDVEPDSVNAVWVPKVEKARNWVPNADTPSPPVTNDPVVRPFELSMDTTLMVLLKAVIPAVAVVTLLTTVPVVRDRLVPAPTVWKVDTWPDGP